MAVHTVGGGGGFLGSLSKIAALGAAFVPGMQPWAAAIGAASALANGDPLGAATSAAGLINNGANAANAANAPAITATGNPPGGVSAVANAGVDQGSPIMRMSPEARAAIAAGRASPMPQLQPTGSMADTFSRLAGNLSSEMGRMFSPAERAYYMNPAQRRF